MLAVSAMQYLCGMVMSHSAVWQLKLQQLLLGRIPDAKAQNKRTALLVDLCEQYV